MSESLVSSQLLPTGVRSQAYAVLDLLLTLVELARDTTELDYDATFIRLIVAEATMHPLMSGPKKRSELVSWPVLPNSLRGDISRVLIAERANLPRETVRRKVNALIDAGKLQDAGHGKVRGNHLLADPATLSRLQLAVAAVNRCYARLNADAAGSVTQQPSIRAAG